MKTWKRRLRAALAIAASVALVIQPAMAGSSNKGKSSSYTLCNYCVWLPGVDCYGELSENECDGTHTKAALKLNYKSCSLELCAKGKVYNWSCYPWCDYVDVNDFVTEVIEPCCYYEGCYYDCWDLLECLDCCKYEVAAPKSSRSKSKNGSSNCVNATLKCTGYLYYYDVAV